jgi:O-antigen ligase/tetratricopeptide (TPR) repeat protein
MKNKIPQLISLSLLTALIYNPFGSNIFELPKLQFLSIFLAITIITLIIYVLKNRKLEIRYNKIIYIILSLWLLSLLLSTIFSIAPSLSFWGSYYRLQGLYSHLVYIGFFLIFLHFLKDKKAQKTFLKALILIASITAVHGIFQQIGLGIFSKHTMEEFLNRSFSTFGHPNFFGQFLLFPIWISLYFLIKKKKIWPYGITTVLLLTSLLLTENRASILGLLAAAAIYILLTIKAKKSFKILIVALMSTGVLSFIFIAAPSTRSLTTRLYIWEGAAKLITDHPLIGSGLETFGLVFQRVTSSKFFELETLYSIADRAHNELIDIFVMQGIFGLIMFLTIILSTLYLAFFKKDKLSMFCGLGLISISVSNLFSFSMTIHYLLIAAIIAIILNNTTKFTSKRIPINLISIFIAGMILMTSFISIKYSVNTIQADMNLRKGMGQIYSEQAKEGIETIIKASKQNLFQGDIYFQLTEIFLQMGKINEDQEDLLIAEDINENAGIFTNYYFRYQFNKARIKTTMKDFESAEKYFIKASELAPINPLILKEWAVMYFEKEDFSKSIEKFEKFLSLIPDYWKNKNNLEELSLEDQKKYRIFTKHVPDLWDVFGYLASSYEKTNNPEKAKYYASFKN